jgi:sulfate adenylyltransferase
MIKHKQGFTLFFTGLSGAGKTTLAKALITKLTELEKRSISFLDGDVVRQYLSSELGYSKEHRDINILRIGYVASEITKHSGIAVCAVIAPYRKTREKVRSMITEYGGFLEIYINTPLEVCKSRDPKGHYIKAEKGQLSNFTGIDGPYEVPENPDICIDTVVYSCESCIDQIVRKLKELGYID